MAKILQQTSMPISSLPSSVSTKAMLEGWVSNPSSADVNIVLTIDGGEFVAYIGYPDESQLRPELKHDGNATYHCKKIRNHGQVAKLGDRLSAEARDAIFPNKG